MPRGSGFRTGTTYKPFHQQYKVANLTKTVNQTHMRIDWSRKQHGFFYYLLSIWDITNPETPVLVNCDKCQQLFNDTFLYYEFQFPKNSTCSIYEFRVTGEECLSHDNKQTVFSSVNGTLSEALNTNVSVTLTPLSEQVVQVNWTPGLANSSYHLVIDDGSGTEPIQVDCVDCPPYHHTLKNCHEGNNISVTVFIPSVHCNDLEFPYQAHRSCTEISFHSSGTPQAWTKYGIIAAIVQAALVWGLQGFMVGQ